jgi:septum formation protein
MNPHHLILASTSKIRQTVLQNAGLHIACVPPALDEEAVKVKWGPLPPAKLAIRLAEEKALSLTSDTDFVIGADQTLSCDDILFHKPASIPAAHLQLTALRGKTHTLHSALACAHQGKIIWSICEEAHLTMRNFSDEYLELYLAANGLDLLTSVGSYKLEKHGVNLFDKIEGDFFTIMGLPLLPLLAFLREQKLVRS